MIMDLWEKAIMMKYAQHWLWNLKEQVWRPRSAFTDSVVSDKLLNFYKLQFSCMKNGIITPKFSEN